MRKTNFKIYFFFIFPSVYLLTTHALIFLSFIFFIDYLSLFSSISLFFSFSENLYWASAKRFRPLVSVQFPAVQNIFFNRRQSYVRNVFRKSIKTFHTNSKSRQFYVMSLKEFFFNNCWFVSNIFLYFLVRFLFTFTHILFVFLGSH